MTRSEAVALLAKSLASSKQMVQTAIEAGLSQEQVSKIASDATRIYMATQDSVISLFN